MSESFHQGVRGEKPKADHLLSQALLASFGRRGSGVDGPRGEFRQRKPRPAILAPVRRFEQRLGVGGRFFTVAVVGDTSTCDCDSSIVDTVASGPGSSSAA